MGVFLTLQWEPTVSRFEIAIFEETFSQTGVDHHHPIPRNSSPGFTFKPRASFTMFPKLAYPLSIDSESTSLRTVSGSLSSRNLTNFECLSRSTSASYCTSSWREPPNHGPKGCSVSTGRNDSTTFKRCMRMPPKRYFGETIATAPQKLFTPPSHKRQGVL